MCTSWFARICTEAMSLGLAHQVVPGHFQGALTTDFNYACGSCLSRSAPKGRQQMGETGFCKNLRFSAVSCENLRFPAVFCANLRLPNPLIYRANRKSAKICKNLRKCAFRVRFLPFAVSLLARPDYLYYFPPYPERRKLTN